MPEKGLHGEGRPEKGIQAQCAGLGISSKRTASGLVPESTGTIGYTDDGKEFYSGALHPGACHFRSNECSVAVVFGWDIIIKAEEEEAGHTVSACSCLVPRPLVSS